MLRERVRRGVADLLRYEELNGPVCPPTALTHVVNDTVHLGDNGDGEPAYCGLVGTRGGDRSFQVGLDCSSFKTDDTMVEPKEILGLGDCLLDWSTLFLFLFRIFASSKKAVGKENSEKSKNQQCCCVWKMRNGPLTYHRLCLRPRLHPHRRRLLPRVVSSPPGFW